MHYIILALFMVPYFVAFPFQLRSLGNIKPTKLLLHHKDDSPESSNPETGGYICLLLTPLHDLSRNPGQKEGNENVPRSAEWAAPELFKPDGTLAPATRQSDVYSLGLTSF